MMTHEKTKTPIFTEHVNTMLDQMAQKIKTEKKDEQTDKVLKKIQETISGKPTNDCFFPLFVLMKQSVGALVKLDPREPLQDEKLSEITFHPIVLSIVDDIQEKKLVDPKKSQEIYETLGKSFDGNEMYVIVSAIAFSLCVVFNTYDIKDLSDPMFQ
jgi:uncharacterized membrane protein